MIETRQENCQDFSTNYTVDTDTFKLSKPHTKKSIFENYNCYIYWFTINFYLTMLTGKFKLVCLNKSRIKKNKINHCYNYIELF